MFRYGYSLFQFQLQLQLFEKKTHASGTLCRYSQADSYILQSRDHTDHRTDTDTPDDILLRRTQVYTLHTNTHSTLLTQRVGGNDSTWCTALL